MRQHGAAHDVADGVDVGQVGAAEFVDVNVAALVEQQADLVDVEPCVLGLRPTATTSLENSMLCLPSRFS